MSRAEEKEVIETATTIPPPPPPGVISLGHPPFGMKCYLLVIIPVVSAAVGCLSYISVLCFAFSISNRNDIWAGEGRGLEVLKILFFYILKPYYFIKSNGGKRMHIFPISFFSLLGFIFFFDSNITAGSRTTLPA